MYFRPDHGTPLHQMVFSALFAALIAAGSFIAIPVGPVPIVLQNMMVLLAGLILGPRWAMVSVAIYLIAGLLGLPVFAGGTGGIARILGPTGGYLLSYLPVAFLVGWLSQKGRGRIWVNAAALTLGSLLVYGIGVPWLKRVTGMDWDKALSAGMIPFLIGDAIKILSAVCIVRALRRDFPEMD